MPRFFLTRIRCHPPDEMMREGSRAATLPATRGFASRRTLLLRGRRDLRRRYGAGFISPRRSNVRDHRRDIAGAEHALPCGHRSIKRFSADGNRAGESGVHDVNDFARVAGHQRISGERRSDRALAVALVARRTVRRIDREAVGTGHYFGSFHRRRSCRRRGLRARRCAATAGVRTGRQTRRQERRSNENADSSLHASSFRFRHP